MMKITWCCLDHLLFTLQDSPEVPTGFFPFELSLVLESRHHYDWGGLEFVLELPVEVHVAHYHCFCFIVQLCEVWDMFGCWSLLTPPGSTLLTVTTGDYTTQLWPIQQAVNIQQTQNNTSIHTECFLKLILKWVLRLKQIVKLQVGQRKLKAESCYTNQYSCQFKWKHIN